MAKILVVDDESRIASICQSILEKWGHEVTCATTGKEFLDKIGEVQYDLMITDLKMPEMDGFMCCEKALSLQPKIGIILMTGLLAMSSREEEMADSFAYRLIRKPFNICDLETAVSGCLIKKSYDNHRIDSN